MLLMTGVLVGLQELTQTHGRRYSSHAPAQRVSRWLSITMLVFLLTVSVGGSATAFDCLAYKPEGARGQWHAEVVAGKICWIGANWRSFLPKPKARRDNSGAANSKSDTQVANRKSEVPVESTATSLPNEAVEMESPHDSPGLRKATPAETAAVTERVVDHEDAFQIRSNAPSVEFGPAPTIDSAAPDISRESSIGDLLIAFSVIALATGALATLIMRDPSQQVIVDAENEQQQVEVQPVDLSLAPPLQPDDADAHQSDTSSFHERLTGLRTKRTFVGRPLVTSAEL
jgi:hypothetical protein